MNRILSKKFFALFILACARELAADVVAMPYYNIRSQGTDLVREMVGWQELINRCDEDKFYGAFAVAGQYSQSFRPERIADCIFGDDLIHDNECASQINITGSCVSNRDKKDWLADYFGLPSDYQGSVSFSPRIKNFVADVQFYVGLSEWADNFYFRLNLPIVHTRWSLNVCEDAKAGSNSQPAGYFSDQVITNDNLLTKATEFFSGDFAPTLALSTGGEIIFQKLAYSKWAVSDCNCNGLSKTALADVAMIFGYNFICNEDDYFGLSLRIDAPTGTHPKGEFLFEPVIGTGHQWYLGAGIHGKKLLWESDCDDTTVSFYIDANIGHLFKACQTRVFDLCSAGENSRYMLAQRLGSNNDSLEGLPTTVSIPGTGTQSDFQFANEFAPVANLTVSKVDVSVAVEADIALKFSYATDSGFTWDLGYEFYGRSCEKISLKSGCLTNNSISDWALKGDASIFGFTNEATPVPVALAATESQATIHSGTNFTNSNKVCLGFDFTTNTVNNLTPAQVIALSNPNIDNPEFASNSADLLTVASGDNSTFTHTSIQPIILSDDDKKLIGSKAITHKVFTHINYTWKDNEDWEPFVGVGASVELNHESSCPATPAKKDCPPKNTKPKSDCASCALNQWSVWVKGGIAFN
ncbi:MAG TPA: hypothetical protein VGT41_06555 [Candidatus Babeliales bacterium]|nr:hypothetical protein [Candidatus Babeliales bacterium]